MSDIKLDFGPRLSCLMSLIVYRFRMNFAHKFPPSAVRYIKLGPKGAWAGDAFQNGTLPLGYQEVPLDMCAAGDWKAARSVLEPVFKSSGAVTDALREVRTYYEFGVDALWVTLAKGHLWWAFADTEVVPTGIREKDAPSRYRRVIGGWQQRSLHGDLLSLTSLSSLLTKSMGYRKTICEMQGAEAYVLRRIQGEDSLLHADAKKVQAQLLDLAGRMIKDLHFADFEVLVDLIFTRNGWRRIGVLGKNHPDVDLVLDHPVTGETAWVQVKSRSSQVTLNDYLERFLSSGADRFFFVCHTAIGALEFKDTTPRLHLWHGPNLAEIAIDAGLFRWLMDRMR